MTGLMKGSESWATTAEGAVTRGGYAAQHELALRNAMESLMRGRMPDARMCHEMVMGAREVRADLVAVGPSHIAAIEVKGEYDNVSRLMHQIGLYQLCVPEVWMVVSADKCDAGRLVRWLLPSCGLIVAHNLVPDWRSREVPPDARLEIEAEPVPRDPHPLMMLEMMWAEELANICNRTMVAQIGAKKPRRAKMIEWLMATYTGAALLVECCTELRARQALWRADPPVGGTVNSKTIRMDLG